MTYVEELSRYQTYIGKYYDEEQLGFRKKVHFKTQNIQAEQEEGYSCNALYCKKEKYSYSNFAVKTTSNLIFFMKTEN